MKKFSDLPLFNIEYSEAPLNTKTFTRVGSVAKSPAIRLVSMSASKMPTRESAIDTLAKKLKFSLGVKKDWENLEKHLQRLAGSNSRPFLLVIRHAEALLNEVSLFHEDQFEKEFLRFFKLLKNNLAGKKSAIRIAILFGCEHSEVEADLRMKFPKDSYVRLKSQKRPRRSQ